MIQPIAQPFAAGAAIMRGIRPKIQQDMAAKAAKFGMAAKAIHASRRRHKMHHRLPESTPNIKADRGRKVARIHRKTIHGGGAGAAAWRHVPWRQSFCVGQGLLILLPSMLIGLVPSLALGQQPAPCGGCSAQHRDAPLIPKAPLSV